MFLAGGIYGLSRAPAGDVALVSALGVRHRLRPLAPPRVWQEHNARVTRRRFVVAVVDQVARCRAGPGDLVAYFLMSLVPRFEGRDWGAEAHGQDDRPAREEVCSLPPPDIAEAARGLPAPALPCPGLLVLGRVWGLASTGRPRGVHVCVGADALAPTGAFVSVDTVHREWQASFDRVVRETAHACVQCNYGTGTRAVAGAFEELARTGAVRRGALVFLDTTPPRIGHVMPRHVNRSLNREVRGDVILTTPFGALADNTAFGDLAVFARTARGSWARIALPRGICIGSGIPACPAGLDADLAKVAYLRWAATRVATNGRFHEHDGRDEE